MFTLTNIVKLNVKIVFWMLGFILNVLSRLTVIFNTKSSTKLNTNTNPNRNIKFKLTEQCG
ncbi:MAG: hypothetical protein OHK0017_11630 [Patescibacteria group bacterium]